jgi:hypothetical protein
MNSSNYDFVIYDNIAEVVSIETDVDKLYDRGLEE